MQSSATTLGRTFAHFEEEQAHGERHDDRYNHDELSLVRVRGVTDDWAQQAATRPARAEMQRGHFDHGPLRAVYRALARQKRGLRVERPCSDLLRVLEVSAIPAEAARCA